MKIQRLDVNDKRNSQMLTVFKSANLHPKEALPIIMSKLQNIHPFRGLRHLKDIDTQGNHLGPAKIKPKGITRWHEIRTFSKTASSGKMI